MKRGGAIRCVNAAVCVRRGAKALLAGMAKDHSQSRFWAGLRTALYGSIKKRKTQYQNRMDFDTAFFRYITLRLYRGFSAYKRPLGA